MSSEADWLLLVGSPGYTYPTYSTQFILNEFTLRKNTSTFISFEAEGYSSLAKKGYFDKQNHCTEGIEYSDSINCWKNCFLESIKVK